FNGIYPKASVVSFIRRVYYRSFAKFFHVSPADVPHFVNLVLTGSLTTYQYSDTSDTDMSVFPNYPLFQRKFGLDPVQARKELIALNIDHLDGTFIPGSPHPLQFFVLPEGIKSEDRFKPGLRSGFDLD